MLKTVDRLMLFIKAAGMSARKFDLSIGASNGYTLRMSKKRASIGSDVIERILKQYPDLNVVWLLTGEGHMLKSQEQTDILDFDSLPSSKRIEIEQIIEQKIQQKQKEQLKSLVKEVAQSLAKN